MLGSCERIQIVTVYKWAVPHFLGVAGGVEGRQGGQNAIQSSATKHNQSVKVIFN